MTKKEQRAQRVRELKQQLIESIVDNPPKKVYISSKMMTTAHAMAETDLTTEEIIIHPEKNTLAESIHSYMHENLHLLMPEEKENMIWHMAHAIYEDMTQRERQKMFRLMARAATWEE